jgi:hypothetical protein
MPSIDILFLEQCVFYMPTFISSYKSLMYNKIINDRITKIYFYRVVWFG